MLLICPRSAPPRASSLATLAVDVHTSTVRTKLSVSIYFFAYFSADCSRLTFLADFSRVSEFFAKLKAGKSRKPGCLETLVIFPADGGQQRAALTSGQRQDIAGERQRGVQSSVPFMTVLLQISDNLVLFKAQLT